MATTYFVRIKPYNKKRGYLVRNFMHRGVRFTTRWKEVSAAMVEELRGLSQPHERTEDIPVFDVKTKEEAAAIEADERDTLPVKMVSRVKDAERVPDSKFRDDAPKIDAATGKIVAPPIEAAEQIEVDGDLDDSGVEPAPSLRRGVPRGRPRKSG